jgi:NAD-dependent histone deacetylase SIR2
MDAARLGSGQPTIKGPSVNIVDLSSEDESDLEDALITHPRVNRPNGANGLDAPDASEDEDEDSENEDWEIESLFEDTLEEMGDEHLFDGGEHPVTPLGMKR